MSPLLRCVSLVCLLLPALAGAQSRASLRAEWRAQQDRLDAIEARAAELWPRRRDTPLRELNISDDEIREIEIIADKHDMNTMLNISPVVTGCPCEEGPLCTDQVYIVSTRPDRTVGLQLSRVRDAWVIGTVQAWWMRFDLLKRQYGKMDFREYLSRRSQLLLEFPQCAFGKDEPASPDTAQLRETPK